MSSVKIRRLDEWTEPRRGGESVVHCHGCFDLLHVGHVWHLQDAKRLGGVLVVTVTSDRHVDKGPGRPVFTARERAEMLAALECVDFVAVNDAPKAVPAIEVIRPDAFVKGIDYKDSVCPLERAAVEARGGRVLFTPTKKYSSTALLGRLSRETLSQRYYRLCCEPSDIYQHLPTLRRLAAECTHVTELGTRHGVSTTALLHAQPRALICYDLVRRPEVADLEILRGGTEFAFHEADSLRVDIAPTDLLFIDTYHSIGQLREELRKHGNQAKKYIVLHDTFHEMGEDGGPGLWQAVEEYLKEDVFAVKERYDNNNGLAVLERVREWAPC